MSVSTNKEQRNEATNQNEELREQSTLVPSSVASQETAEEVDPQQVQGLRVWEIKVEGLEEVAFRGAEVFFDTHAPTKVVRP